MKVLPRIFNITALAVLLTATSLRTQSSDRVYAAGGTIITVTTALDNITANEFCSLREAITNANNDAATFSDCPGGSGSDTIIFADDISTITLESTLPGINDADGLTIIGDGDVILNGNHTVQILIVNSSGSLNLENLNIVNARDMSFSSVGIVNRGTLTVTNSTFSGSFSHDGDECLQHFHPRYHKQYFLQQQC